MYQEIELIHIKPSPLNPRKEISGPKFDELCASIKAKGVIEPIIVRPIKGRAPFEIVAGERRFKAAGAAGLTLIPAIVRELSDDEAYDFMLIENLQREDLTDREEAESFQAYTKLHGKDAIAALSEKTGITQGYIRSRIHVLDLPAKVLKLWGQGELSFGHLQQLLRVADDEARFKEEIEWLLNGGDGYDTGAVTVKELREHIDEEAPALSAALFKSGEICRACPSNSTVQKNLFGIEGKGAQCLNPGCFKKHQAEWLGKNWKSTKIAKEYKTNGFRFREDAGYGTYNEWGWRGKPGKKCAECPNFVSIIDLSCKKVRGEGYNCVGEKSCFNAVTNPKSAREKETGERDPEAPRASWHGEYFRDVFLSKRIPEALAKLDLRDPKLRILLLACAIHGNRSVLATSSCEDYSGGILRKEKSEAEKSIQKVIAQIVLSGQHVGPTSWNGFGTKGRRIVAEYLGIDLAKEFSVDAEYLEKKTKAEIIAFGRKFKIFDQAKKLMKTKAAAADPEKLKKSELVELILKSGVNLVGKVPAEILEARTRKP